MTTLSANTQVAASTGPTLESIIDGIEQTRASIQAISGRLSSQLILLGFKELDAPCALPQDDPSMGDTAFGRLKMEAMKLNNERIDLDGYVSILERQYYGRNVTPAIGR